MQTGQNVRFGHKVWLTINVQEPEQELAEVQV